MFFVCLSVWRSYYLYAVWPVISHAQALKYYNSDSASCRLPVRHCDPFPQPCVSRPWVAFSSCLPAVLRF